MLTPRGRSVDVMAESARHDASLSAEQLLDLILGQGDVGAAAAGGFHPDYTDALIDELAPEHADELRAERTVADHWPVLCDRIAAKWSDLFGRRRADWTVVSPAVREGDYVAVVQVTRRRSVGATAATGWALDAETFETIGLEFRLNGDRWRLSGLRLPDLNQHTPHSGNGRARERNPDTPGHLGRRDGRSA